MLPPKSFHMTIIDLLCNLARTPEHWSSKLPLDTEYPVIKKKINGWLKDLLPQKNIRVKFENLTDYNVTVKSLVKPADIKSKTLINKFRETTILATGARHPGHKIYAFHISMAYIIRFLSADEEKSVNDFLRSWQEIFVREFGIVEFGPPQLVFFPNMHQFSVK